MNGKYRKRKNHGGRGREPVSTAVRAAPSSPIIDARDPKPLGLRISVDADIKSAMVQVRWCISPELRDHISGKTNVAIESLLGSLHWFVILVVADKHGTEVDRRVCALRDQLDYVPLRRTGQHTILATVESAYGMLERTARGSIVDEVGAKDTRWSYSRRLLRHDATDFVHENHRAHSAAIYVDVPEDVFGKPLAPLFRKWVYLMRPGKPPVDECDQRKWVLFALLIQPVVVALMVAANLAVISFVALFLLSLGIVGMRPKAFLAPFKDPLDWRATGRLFTADNEFREEFVQLRAVWFYRWTWPLSFAMPLPVYFGYLAYGVELDSSVWFWIFSIIAASTAVVYLGLVFGVWMKIADTVEEWLEERVRRKMAALDALTCEDGKPACEPKHRTIRLIFLATKQKMCKPMARGA